MNRFDRTEIKHVPRKQNTRAYILSKLESTKKKGGNKSVIQEYLSLPSIEKYTAPPKVNAIGDNSCWMSPVFNFLTKGELSVDQKEATTTKRRACSYVALEHKLYRRGFSIPLLKCIEESTRPCSKIQRNMSGDATSAKGTQTCTSHPHTSSKHCPPRGRFPGGE